MNVYDLMFIMQPLLAAGVFIRCRNVRIFRYLNIYDLILHPPTTAEYLLLQHFENQLKFDLSCKACIYGVKLSSVKRFSEMSIWSNFSCIY